MENKYKPIRECPVLGSTLLYAISPTSAYALLKLQEKQTLQRTSQKPDLATTTAE